jgi:hypothetical protein
METVVRHGEMIAEEAREGKERKMEHEAIKMLGVIKEKVTVPKGDGSSGSALYSIPIELSQVPTQDWIDAFKATWDNPPSFTSMHRPGIVRIHAHVLWLDGTTLEELKKVHMETLKLCINKANETVPRIEEKRQNAKDQEEERIRQHRQHVNQLADEIDFGD